LRQSKSDFQELKLNILKAGCHYDIDTQCYRCKELTEHCKLQYANLLYTYSIKKIKGTSGWTFICKKNNKYWSS